MIAPLADYGLSPIRGFVPDPDPPVDIHPDLAPFEAIAQDIAGLIRLRRLRAAIRALPPTPLPDLSPRDAERAFLTLTVLTNAWVWGDETPDLALPAVLADPVTTLARQLDRPPIVSHTSMSVWNWRRIDPELPPSAENSELLVRFLGGTDETWFFTAALGVELAGALPMAHLHKAAAASAAGDLDETTDAMGRVAETIGAINAALDRVRDWCDPGAFYRRTRPFLAGWPAPGLTYHQGQASLMLAGGSAGQSALIQTFDAALGVRHSDRTAAFLGDMRRYMPRHARAYLGDLDHKARIRDMVTAAQRTDLTDAYDTTIAALDLFRRKHMGLAMDYVVKPSGATATIGTGGTDFTDILRDARRATAASRSSPR